MAANTFLTKKQANFIRANYEKMSNAQIAAYLKINIAAARPKIYALGLYRMQLDYWTPEQIEFLKKHYKKLGDKELAIYYNGFWEKEKRWTLKHIEKKRMYLKLKRTAKELKDIRQRNKLNGCWQYISCWKTENQAPVGTIKIWEASPGYFVKVIKTKKGFVHYRRWLYENQFGPIPKGHVVRLKDQDQMNVVPENLELIKYAENGLRNLGARELTDFYVAGRIMGKTWEPELFQTIKSNKSIIDLKRHQLLLNRAINDARRNTTQT